MNDPMTDLHDPLEDLVADVPSYVVADASVAWAAGRRRRTRRRVGGAVAVAALVVLVGGFVRTVPQAVPLQPAGGSESGPVDGYPSQVEKPWFERTLPERPGPVAALLGEAGAWHAVAADGRIWRLTADDLSDDYPPALSGDGRLIGYLSSPSGYEIRDLVSGETTSFPEIGDNRTVHGDQTYGLAGQAPAFWSPDRSRVLVRGWRWQGEQDSVGSGLVLGRDGSIELVGSDHGQFAGWLDADTLGWLEVTGKGASRKAMLVGTGVTGQVVSRVPLELPTGALTRISQWSADLSPDGLRLALEVSNAAGTLVTLSALDGSVISEENVWTGGFGCVTSWVDDEPTLFQFDGTLSTTDGRVLVSVDQRFEHYCLAVAADALAGERHESVGERLFGRTWLSWHWREVGLGTLGGLALLGGLAVLVVRRRRLSA